MKLQTSEFSFTTKQAYTTLLVFENIDIQNMITELIVNNIKDFFYLLKRSYISIITGSI